MISLRSLSVLGSFSVSLLAIGCGSGSSSNGTRDGGSSEGGGGGTDADGGNQGGGTSTLWGGASTGGAAGKGGASSRAGAGGSAVNAGGDTADSGVPTPCGLSDEKEPNETLDTGTPYTLGSAVTGCIATADDHDFYEFIAPSGDAAGGYAQVALTGVGHGTISLSVYTASDNASILRASSTSTGTSVNVWIGVVPGQKYRFDVSNNNTFADFDQEYRYTAQLTYTKIDDVYEPNDTRSASKPVAYPLAVNAYMFAGFRDRTLSAGEYDDWYNVTFPVGTVTIKIQNVPTDILADLQLVNSAGAEVASGHSNTEGANVTITAPVAGGAYTVRAGAYDAFSTVPQYGTAQTAPDHFTRSYKLSATVAP